MARPSRAVENRQRRERKRKKTREFKRGKPTIAPQKQRIVKPPSEIIGGFEEVTKKRVSTVKPRRVPKRRGIETPLAGRREILIVSRKGQPQVFTQIEALEKRDYLGTVSSSWLSSIGYIFNKKMGLFTTQKSAKLYRIFNFPFEVFEEWFYAHSKGTFWNDFIRDQYTIE